MHWMDHMKDSSNYISHSYLSVLLIYNNSLRPRGCFEVVGRSE